MPRDFDRNDLSGLRREDAEAGQRASAGQAEPAFEPGQAGPPLPEAPEGASWQTGEPVMPPAGQASGGKSAPKASTIAKVLAVLAAGCVGSSLILGVLSMGVITLGFASCMRSCSDNPIGDTRENAAFIADRTASSRDLEVFDALSGAIGSLQTRLSGRSGEEGSATPSVEELRAMVAAGQWPEDDVSEALSPRVWVRIAELSQDWLEDETGESWQVVDFGYPFPDSGPVPVPAVRDEKSRCMCRLRCTSGEDADVYTMVYYYRWAEVAYFSSTLAEDRAHIAESEALLEKVAASGLLGERDYLLSNTQLLVWELGADDELRDPEAFAACINELGALLGESRRMTLLAHDTPATLRFDPLSSNYPNEHPDEVVPFDEARTRLLRCGYTLYFDCAGEEVLLGCYWRPDKDVTPEDLEGTLAPSDDRANWRHPWRAPREECLFDDALAVTAAETLGTTEDQVIAASELTAPSDPYNALTVWVIVPAGTLPETPQAFCATANELLDAIWGKMAIDPERINSLYVHLFELDESTAVDAAGEPVVFASLRELSRANPHDLEGYSFDILLSAMPSMTQWPEDDEPNRHYVEPSDVGGTITLRRDWRYSSE